MLLHLHRGFHHTKHHLHHFHIKHNVSVLTIGLLLILSIQINLFYYLGMMPIQTMTSDANLSFAGSVLPAITEIIKDITMLF